MVLPHEPREDRDPQHPCNREAIAPQRLAGEDGQDLQQDPHPGNGEDVDLRVAEEPEQVLVEVRAPADLVVEEACLGGAVEHHHQERRDEDGRPRPHRIEVVNIFIRLSKRIFIPKDSKSRSKDV